MRCGQKRFRNAIWRRSQRNGKKRKKREQRTLIQLHPPPLRGEAPDVLVDVPPAAGLEVAVQLGHIAARLGDAAQAHDGHDAVDALQGHGARRGEVLDAERHDLVGRLEVGGGDLPAEGRVLGWVGLDAVDFLDGGEVGRGEDCSILSVIRFAVWGVSFHVRDVHMPEPGPISRTVPDTGGRGGGLLSSLAAVLGTTPWVTRPWTRGTTFLSALRRTMGPMWAQKRPNQAAWRRGQERRVPRSKSLRRDRMVAGRKDRARPMNCHGSRRVMRAGGSMVAVLGE